jgi:hypothetical protein
MKLGWIVRLIVAALAVSLLAPVAIAGAGENGENEQKGTTYVGTVEGTDAYIGIVLTKGEDTALVYVCDSAGLTEWFQAGVKKGDQLSGISPGGAVLVGTRLKSAIKGTLVLFGGEAHDYTAKKASGDAGLYRLPQSVGGAEYVAGWVQLTDGTFRGDVTRTGVPNPIASTTLDASTEPPPDTTTPPPDTTTPPADTTPLTEQGLPAPGDIKAQFPTDPPPDAQVLSATAEGDVTIGGDTTVSTEAGGAPTTTTTIVPLKATAEQCAGFNKQLESIQVQIGEALDGIQTRRKKKEVKELNASFNALSDAAVAAGCKNVFGSVD